MFDANVNKKQENYWLCERHGGRNNIARANSKDEEFRNGIPGAERRMRFARVRAKQRKAAAFTGHIPSFLDPRPVTPKPKAKKVAPVVQAKSAKQLRREAAMAELGLTEADILAAFGA